MLPYGYGLSYVSYEGAAQKQLSDNLPEHIENDEGVVKNTAVFAGKVVKPWRMFLTSNTQTSELLSNSGALPGATYRTIDKVVQEDAFRLETNGREKAGISFSSSFREDLSFELEQKSALVMTLMRDSDISGAVNIAMSCESEGDVAGSCRAEVDIQQQLKAVPKGEWREVAIDLQCFAKSGVQLDKIVSPFELSTDGVINLSFSDIRFMPNVFTESNECIKE